MIQTAVGHLPDYPKSDRAPGPHYPRSSGGQPVTRGVVILDSKISRSCAAFVLFLNAAGRSAAGVMPSSRQR